MDSYHIFLRNDMELSELDKIIAERNSRIKKRKEDGTLFEEEVAKGKKGDDDARLAKEVESQKEKMAARMQSRMPPCPQCGKKMTFLPEESMVMCETCQIGMRV